MNVKPRPAGGSRYLYEPFHLTAVRVDANEKVMEARWHAVEQRLAKIETGLERMERRLWLAVAGIAAFLATSLAQTYIATHFS